MTDGRAKELVDLGDRLFEKKRGLHGLWQEIALNFYPEKASFTSELQLGEEYNDNMDSFPGLLRRELGNAMSATLRPRDQKWFAATTGDEDVDNDPEAASYLEYIATAMRRGIYDSRTKFVRATKEGDHDFVTFGQAVISVEEAPNRDHLFFRSHHLAHCAWLENEIGEIDHLHRMDKMTARMMKRMFGEKRLCEKVKKACEKSPGDTFNIRVIVMPADEYDYVEGGGKIKDKKGASFPFVVVYVDADNQCILREGGLPTFIYNVPRWHTISGSQYAFSPATSTALPDARMAQSLARILLEAGEKTADPPMIGTTEAVREVNLHAGALSWVDYDYDERLGAALRPIDIKADLGAGLKIRQDVREMLSKAFFVDKPALPEAGKQMTAYEIRTRLEEHVRNLLPLFEPMEMEYNNGLLDRSFALMRHMGHFDFQNMPDVLSSADIAWTFKNPLQEASTRILVEQFQEAMQIEKVAMESGASSSRVNVSIARDDAIRGSGGPAKWRRSDDQIAAEQEAKAQQSAMMNAAQTVARGADIAGKVGDAAQSLQAGGLLPPPAPASAQVAPGNVRPPAAQKKPPLLRQAA